MKEAIKEAIMEQLEIKEMPEEELILDIEDTEAIINALACNDVIQFEIVRRYNDCHIYYQLETTLKVRERWCGCIFDFDVKYDKLNTNELIARIIEADATARRLAEDIVSVKK